MDWDQRGFYRKFFPIAVVGQRRRYRRPTGTQPTGLHTAAGDRMLTCTNRARTAVIVKAIRTEKQLRCTIVVLFCTTTLRFTHRTHREEKAEYGYYSHLFPKRKRTISESPSSGTLSFARPRSRQHCMPRNEPKREPTNAQPTGYRETSSLRVNRMNCTPCKDPSISTFLLWFTKSILKIRTFVRDKETICRGFVSHRAETTSRFRPSWANSLRESARRFS